MQNARENPLAAAAAAAAVSGAPPPQANAENLLDIDFDGAAPASAQKEPGAGMSGLEGLAGTPQRIQSPVAANGPSRPPVSMGGMDDLMGLSNGSSGGGGGGGNNNMMGGGGGGLEDLMGQGPPETNGSAPMGGMSDLDILGGFASMDMNPSRSNQPMAPAMQQQQQQQQQQQSTTGDGQGGKKSANQDLLDLF